jgi:hypothetical protein
MTATTRRRRTYKGEEGGGGGNVTEYIKGKRGGGVVELEPEPSPSRFEGSPKYQTKYPKLPDF